MSFGRRLGDLARSRTGQVAIIVAHRSEEETSVTWDELERRSNQLARLFTQRGAARGTFVAIALPNGIDHVVAAYAAWKLGACALPLNPGMPPAERGPILDLVAASYPLLVVGDWSEVTATRMAAAELGAADALPGDLLPDVVSRPGKAMPSGGSTGRPKIVINDSEWRGAPRMFLDEFGASLGMRPGQKTLITGSLHGNTFFEFTHWALFEGNPVVIMERFDPERAIALIELHRIAYAVLVPTMMRRILDVPGLRERDLSSLEAIFHTTAPCPPAIKRAWIDLLGGERVYEGYGATEGFGTTTIRGDQWLLHPGSVGRPTKYSEVLVLDAEGRPAPADVVGEVYLRRKDLKGTPSRYLGAEIRPTPGGAASVGDLGWLDAGGYLYIADRRTDMIVTGGTNVYPAEVEAVLIEHPGVADVAVVGVADDDWGRRVHAVIQPRDPSSPPSTDELAKHCRSRLQPAKVPKSWEFVSALPRDGVGKIRRSALVEPRS